MPETTDTTEINALLKTATTEAANALQEIAEKSDSKDTKKAAKRALYLLSQKGIAPSETPSAFTPASKNALPDVTRFLMSNIDGAGNQMLWFVLPDAYGGRPLLFSVLASDEEGIKDYLAIKMTPDKIEGKIHEYSTRMNAFFVDMAPDYGRWLVARARELSRENRKSTPRGFLEYAARLGEPQQQYDVPPLDDLPAPEALEADETFPRDAAALFARPVFELWFLGMEVIMPELAQWMKDMAEKNDDSPDESVAKREAIIKRITEKVITPETQARYVERLLLSAIVLWKIGDETTAKQSLYHAQQLQKDAFHSDFASDLMRRTLEAARDMFLSAMRERDAASGASETE